jgi:hypothetical protein
MRSRLAGTSLPAATASRRLLVGTHQLGRHRPVVGRVGHRTLERPRHLSLLAYLLFDGPMTVTELSERRPVIEAWLAQGATAWRDVLGPLTAEQRQVSSRLWVPLSTGSVDLRRLST